MLTPRQAQALYFIADYIALHDGVSPTLDDIAKVLGLRAKSGAFRIVCELVERGFIRRHHGAVRGVEVVGLPDLPVKVPVGAPQYVADALTWLQQNRYGVLLLPGAMGKAAA